MVVPAGGGRCNGRRRSTTYGSSGASAAHCVRSGMVVPAGGGRCNGRRRVAMAGGHFLCAAAHSFSPPSARTIPRSAPALSGIPLHCLHTDRRRTSLCSTTHGTLGASAAHFVRSGMVVSAGGGRCNGRRREEIAIRHVLSAAAHLPSRAARRTIPRNAPALSGIPIHCPRISRRRNPLALNDPRHFRSFRRSLRSQRNGGARRGRGVNGRRQEGMSVSHALCAAAHSFSPPPALRRTIPRSAPALSGIPIHYHHINRWRNPPCVFPKFN